jgi:hypothetical protein
MFVKSAGQDVWEEWDRKRLLLEQTTKGLLLEAAVALQPKWQEDLGYEDIQMRTTKYLFLKLELMLVW